MAGVITTKDALAGGLSKYQLYGGSHRRLLHGVHEPVDLQPSWWALIDAARTVLPDDAYMTGPTALVMRGVRFLSAMPLWVASAHQIRRAEILAIRDSRASTRDDVAHGVATPALALQHMARRSTLMAAIVAADQAIRVGVLGDDDLARLADTSTGRRIASLARAGSDSPRETRLRVLVISAGLPEPTTQLAIPHTHGVDHVDLGWDEWRVAAEYEGDHHRTDQTQWNRDIARYERLTGAGWSVIRVTAADLRERIGVIGRIHAALRAHGYRGRTPRLSASWHALNQAA